jgi:hypothetical protein
MYSTYDSAALIRAAIRSCGGHAVLIHQFGTVPNATVPLKTDALVIDVSHPGCERAITTAAASRLPVVACAFGVPTPAMRALLEVSGIQLLPDPDPDTVCDALVSAIGRKPSTERRKGA